MANVLTLGGGEYESYPEFTDIDFDGDYDLFIGNFWGLVHHWENIGTPQEPEFQFVTDSLDLIDVPGYSKLSFIDLDSDDDFDLFIGNYYGTIWYYENVGTSQVYNLFLETEQFGGIDVGQNASPCLVDINSDGDYDLFIGNKNGNIWYYENTGTPDSCDFTYMTDYFDSIDVGDYASPEFADVDGDGDYDLFVGRDPDYPINGPGDVYFYENVGNAQQYSFEFVTTDYLGIDESIYTVTDLVDIDADGDYDLFIGEKYNGIIWYYRNDGDSANYDFTYVTDNFAGIDVGYYSSPEFADIDGDCDYDLFVGREPDWAAQTPGDVFFYENIGTPQQADFQLVTTNYLSIDEGHLTHMDWIDIDADGDEDMFTACGDELQFYRNVGTNETPSLIRETSNYQNIVVYGISPFFCDIDADGDYDLFSGEGVLGGPSPGLHLFINRGTPEEADFILYSDNLVPGTYHVIIYPTLADIDADEDFDLFLCDQGGSYFHFENTGTIYNPNFVWRSDNWQGIDPVQIQRWSRFWDIDEDGDLDLFFNGDENVAFYRNTGTPDSAVMTLETPYGITGLNYSVTTGIWGFDIVDIDADGDGDFFGGNTNGGALFFRNVTGQNEVGPKRPDILFPKLDFSIGPNPANPVTWISFTLPSPQEATLAVYNILGAKVTTLTSGIQPPGTHNYLWNAAEYSSGVYIIRLDAREFEATDRVVVLK
ncbi:hypothetical protein CEE37_03465 [candidate division LCP-89 bacterium B3_LCP]|uniref:Secretion system C-terminal sorting domain-containing protein n=1 Tax=candidate division LCP-89 bacterium B3_LCP TaxID=2012998 RepID=A0A532V3C4_UNCL8|nr:MAG: hypothetical protein CEE37_03465 [candidate division LCP-89 bacterium B3_LCP]